MTEIERLLKAALTDKDKKDLLAFLDAADQGVSPLRLRIVERGPTNGGKSSHLAIKLVRPKAPK